MRMEDERGKGLTRGGTGKRWAAVPMLAVALASWLSADCRPDAGEAGASEKIASVERAFRFTGGARWVARHGLSSAAYQNEFTKWVGAGYRLTYVSGYSVNNQDFYAATWELSSGPGWFARHAMTAAQYQTEMNNQVANGLHPVLVNGYTVNGVDLYAAIWEGGPVNAWIARHGMTAAQYQTEFNNQAANGYRLIHVSGYGGSTETFAAIWQQNSGPAWFARHAMTSADYQTEFNNRIALGYHLVLVGGYPVPGDVHYVAIWEQGSVEPWAAYHAMSATTYQQKIDDLRYQGYRPIMVSGYNANGSPQFAALWRNYGVSSSDLAVIDNAVNGVLSASGAPAISIAVAKDGRLVFAKAYGIADGGSTTATTANLFRIASVSKPITSVAIMTLVEQGYLHLDDLVFGTGALLGTTYGTQPYSARLKAITVRHLLSHTSGGWPNDANDPMFQDPSWSQTQVINWALNTLPQTSDPGTTYAYSNFGFCLLGRIIERVTGQTYESWVQQNVLWPIGATGMQITTNSAATRKPNEVVYDSRDNPYGPNVVRMDAHGGWIASPVDLLHFLTHVDGFAPPPDILTASSETTMTTGTTPSGGGYGLGWSLTTHNVTDRPCVASATNPCTIYWHNGSMPGTESILVRTSGHYTWAAITNTRFNGPDIDGMMWTIVNNVTNWPSYDLFAPTPSRPLGDVTGDGRSDVVLTGGTNWSTVPVAAARSDGGFNVTNAFVSNFPAWTASAGAKSLAGDFNGDGRADVAVTGVSGWGSLPVAFSNGDGTFNVTNVGLANFPGWAATSGVKQVTGDFNGDGKTDIALVGGPGWTTVPIAFSNGDGSFNVTVQTVPNIPIWATQPGAHPVAGDFNGDGRGDIALTGGSNWTSIPVAFSKGDGTFVVTNMSVGTFPGLATAASAVPGDFNGDGVGDIALTGGSGWASIPVAFGNGNGTFTFTNSGVSNFPTWATQSGAKPVAGDFNGDGLSDIVLTGGVGWGTIPVAYSTGMGTFSVSNPGVTDFPLFATQSGARPVNPQ